MITTRRVHGSLTLGHNTANGIRTGHPPALLSVFLARLRTRTPSRPRPPLLPLLAATSVTSPATAIRLGRLPAPLSPGLFGTATAMDTPAPRFRFLFLGFLRFLSRPRPSTTSQQVAAKRNVQNRKISQNTQETSQNTQEIAQKHRKTGGNRQKHAENPLKCCKAAKTFDNGVENGLTRHGVCARQGMEW
ncbi:hypothetical protein C8R47DRAFT_1113050 [Mycena vitilis]|nr:hypothetical protein C8R47DRAFT_1113050 [Mycena vitilis]